MSCSCRSCEIIKETKKANMRNDPTVQNVIQKMKDRSDEGMVRYGMTIRENDKPLVEWLEEALEEAMDQCVYLERAIEEARKQ